MHEECEQYAKVIQEKLEKGEDFLRPVPAYDDTPKDLAKRCVLWLLQQGWVREGVKLYPELKLKLWDEGKTTCLTQGTADLVMVGSDYVRVIDWKSNRDSLDPIDAENQINAYVTAAMQHFDKPTGEGFLYLPRLEEVYRYWLDDVNEGVRKVREILEVCLSENTPYDAGPWCQYCTGKLTCPELKEVTTELVTQTTEEIALEGENPLELTEDKLISRVESYLLANREHIERYSKILPILRPLDSGIRSAIKKLIHHGEEVPGWEIRKTKGRTADTEALWAVASEVLTEEEFIAFAKVSLPKVEDAYARKMQTQHLKETGERMTLKAAREDFSERMGANIRQKPSEQLRRVKGEK